MCSYLEHDINSNSNSTFILNVVSSSTIQIHLIIILSLLCYCSAVLLHLYIQSYIKKTSKHMDIAIYKIGKISSVRRWIDYIQIEIMILQKNYYIFFQCRKQFFGGYKMTLREITSVMKNINISYGYTDMIKCIGTIALLLLLANVDITSCEKNQNQTKKGIKILDQCLNNAMV